MPDEPNELELVATDDLIHELQRRSDHLVIAYELKASSNEGMIIQHSGGVFAAIGLLYVALDSLAIDLRPADASEDD